MHRDSLVVSILSAVITTGILGGAWYVSERQQATPAPAAPGEQPGWTTLQPSAGLSPSPSGRPSPSASASTSPSAFGQATVNQTVTEPGSRFNSSTGEKQNVPAGTSRQRTDTPIKCIDPELGEFWTNAASCNGADLNNRLSYADPMPISPARDAFDGRTYRPPEDAAANSRVEPRPAGSRSSQPAPVKPNLRLAGKSPPAGLPPECKFPVGKALETERALAAADNPYRSRWRDTYCEFRCEASQDQCPVPDSYYYFDFAAMCHGTAHYPCYRTAHPEP